MTEPYMNTRKPIDLNAPGAIDALLSYHRHTFGDVRMADDPATPAEPVLTVPVPTPPPTGVDLSDPAVQAIVERARGEEKTKLYATLEEWKTKAAGLTDLQKTVETLKSEQEQRIAEAAAAAAKEAEEKARKEWDESDAKTLVEKANASWEERFATMQAERDNEREMLLKDNQFAQLQSETQRLVNEAVNANLIAPELANLVTGNNADEIRASLETVKAASEAIATSVAATLQQAAPAATPLPRGVSPTGYAPNEPMDAQEQTRTLTADDIRQMPMSEWAKIRNSLPGVNREQSNRGLFG